MFLVLVLSVKVDYKIIDIDEILRVTHVVQYFLTLL